jgi:ABC-type branched-subunit amino acid transport system ATPase component
LRATRVSPRPRTAIESYPFPIEGYDQLVVAEIVPLLPELDDEELVAVLLREQKGANRAAIVNRIDALLEGEG